MPRSKEQKILFWIMFIFIVGNLALILMVLRGCRG
jgi:hypothetical protein